MKYAASRRETESAMSASPGDAVVVAGHVCLDLIPQFEGGHAGLDALLIPGKLSNVGPLVASTGGAVSNTGVALHRLGFPTRLMGKVGDDVVGRAILDILGSHGAELLEDMIVAAGQPSSYTVVISLPQVDRVFLHCPGANDSFCADDVDSARLSGARLFHFGYPPLMRRMFVDGGVELSSLLTRVRDCGLATSLDMARPDPASEAGRANWRQLLERVLDHVDFFLPSFEEILFMLDRKRFDRLERDSVGGDLNALADGALLRDLSDQLLAMGAAIVLLKLGTQGVYLRTTPEKSRLADCGAGAPAPVADWVGRELLAPCLQADVVGATGAGDCAIAGFLAGILRGMSPEAAMVSATAVGACNVEQADATSGIPAWSVVQQRIESGWPRRRISVSLPGWQWDETAGVRRGSHDPDGS
jgi:sugar/nucleoside kinase (ribokinase family)